MAPLSIGGTLNRAIETSGARVYAWAHHYLANIAIWLYKAIRLYLALYR